MNSNYKKSLPTTQRFNLRLEPLCTCQNEFGSGWGGCGQTYDRGPSDHTGD